MTARGVVQVYKMEHKIRYGIIGLITALTIFGGVIVLSDAELENAWYCDNNGRVGIFEEMSSTNKSGYWMEDDIRRRATCTNSAWIPLIDYCEQEGIKNCNRIDAQPATEDSSWTGKYLCKEFCEKIYLP